ncbi:MAG: RND transporter, partial [Betaproteobacteria bacterium]
MKAALALTTLLLVGCASLSPDAGFSDVEQAVTQRTGAQTKWVRSAQEADPVRARVKELLAKPVG